MTRCRRGAHNGQRRSARRGVLPAAVRLLLALVALLSLVSGACAGEVRVSAAASLKDVVGAVIAEYGKSHGGTRVVANFAGSGTLAKQIANGAPADIFISAGADWTEYLKKEKVVDVASITPFTFNTLVFAGYTEKKVTGMKDLLRLEKIAIGSPKSVPAGEYAMEALTKAGVARELQNRLVFAKDVRESLLYAERGDVDGAFVYRTEALLARQAKVLFSVPGELHNRIVYPMALTASGAKNVESLDFYKFLQGRVSKGLLARYGFVTK